MNIDSESTVALADPSISISDPSMSFGPNTAFDPTHVWIAKELMCGGLAASIGIVIGNPFDVIKVRQQTMPEVYSSPIKCFKDIVKYEGVGGLYKGLLSPVLAQFFIGALSFAANSVTMKILEPDLKRGEPGQFHNSFIAGCVGGFAQCIVLVPTDLVKCKMQTDQMTINGATTKRQFSSSYDCMRQILVKEGVRGLFRGFVSTACREVPAFGIYFGSYTHLMNALTPKEATQTPVSAILTAGGVAGALSWGVVYPVDVVKTNIQLSTDSAPVGGGASLGKDKNLGTVGQHAHSSSNSNSVIGMTRTLYQRHGYTVFFRGFSTAVVRAFPVNAAVFFFYELFRGHLGI